MWLIAAAGRGRSAASRLLPAASFRPRPPASAPAPAPAVQFSSDGVARQKAAPAPVQQHFDVLVVGGGIVGLAAARELINRHPGLRMAVVDKECRVAYHQTGHNSGVIHAGVYYQPGSLKARLCVEGMRLAYEYCARRGVPVRRCGKLIVATNEEEVARLDDLLDRGTRNGVADLRLLANEKAIRGVEPHCAGLRALHSPHTGIVDWALVTSKFAEDFQAAGGKIFLGKEVTGFSSNDVDASESRRRQFPLLVHAEAMEGVAAGCVVVCAGLHSDRLAVLSGCDPDPKVVPFRGEYLLLDESRSCLVRGNIYPVPDPRFPFLGVHLTPRMDGSVWLGPNAVPAFSREGYTWGSVSLRDMREMFAYPGFARLAWRYKVRGTDEVFRSFFLFRQVQQLRKMVPSLRWKDVRRGPSGVRAQAMNRQGQLVDDFVFDVARAAGSPLDRVLHCRNAPSPGATSSMAIAKVIADRAEQEFGLGGASGAPRPAAEDPARPAPTPG